MLAQRCALAGMTTRPTSRTHAWLHARSARAAFCSTTRTVSPSSRFRRARISKISRTIIGASPSDGSSSISRRGRAISARPRASICCSPPESVPAGCRSRSASRGKNSSTRRRSPVRVAIAADVRAELQVLADGELADHPAALGHVRDPEPRDRLRRPAGERPPVEANLARLAHGVRDRAQRRRLARRRSRRAPRPSRPPAPGARRRAARARPVAGVDPLELEERHYGRRPRCRGTPRSPPGRAAPPAASRPRSSGRSRARARGRRRPSPGSCGARRAARSA